jgi:hypothetical protein
MLAGKQHCGHVTSFHATASCCAESGQSMVNNLVITFEAVFSFQVENKTTEKCSAAKNLVRHADERALRAKILARHEPSVP